MSCHDCGNKNDDCGCTQEGLHISQVCNPIECESDECTESFPAECSIYTGEDILCNNVVIVTAGDSMAQAVANITAYFCTRTTTQTDIVCGEDIVVLAETSVADALIQTVTYFCNALDALALQSVDHVTANLVATVPPTPNYTIVTLWADAAETISLGAFNVSNGADGADGTDGVDGIDGIDGIDGADGTKILSAYNSQTGAGNLSGVSTLNAIVFSIPGNTLANDGDEYEIDLYTEYIENDPVDLEVGIGAGATWTKTIQNAENDKRFFKIIISRIDQNNQMWTIKVLSQNALSQEYVDEMDVIYTTKDLSTTENWTVNLINNGDAGANALVLHKAVLKLNKV